MFGIRKKETVPCKTCGKPTPMLGTKLCDSCWEVETRLSRYLNNENAIQFVSAALYKVGRKLIQATPAESRYGHKLAELGAQYGRESEWICPRCGYRNAANNEVCMGAEMGDGRCGKSKPKSKPKPLAQYLAEYLATGIDRTHEAGMPMDFTEEGLKPILEQALDAYQGTENVTIKIERNV